MSDSSDASTPQSAVERTLVARGWADLDLVERLGSAATRRARSATIEADRERARLWYHSPVSEHVPPALVEMYESEANVVRYRRIIDFLTPGERVHEVGIGYGYLAVLMLREARLGGYRGIDLMPRFVASTRRMIEANDLTEGASVEQQDLYDLTRADVEALGANLLVCCEVIEHVPDPEGALSTLARALPEGTDLLFSVPLLGRLESIWGHGQTFGAARLHGMLERAGLVAHHVEVLHDTWALILASGTPRPSPRAAAALQKTAEVDPARFLTPAFSVLTNTPVAELTRAKSHWTKRVAGVSIEPCAVNSADQASPPAGLRLRARAQRATAGPGKGWSAQAGLAFAVPEGTKGVRLEVTVADPEDLTALRVEFRAAGERSGLWVWKPAERRPKASRPTFLIAPGRTGESLRRVPGSTSEGADTVEVYAQARDDQPIDVSILRWAWVTRAP